jgi:dUTP pyrophosphatase
VIFGTRSPFPVVHILGPGVFVVAFSSVSCRLSSLFQRPTLRFVRLSERAVAPVRSSASAAGATLFSAVSLVVPAHGKAVVATDLSVSLPDDCYGRIAPLSELDAHIKIGAGVIDPDYRGSVGIVIFNHGSTDFQIHPGDKLAQLICHQFISPEIQEVVSLDDTERGASGFGSTGVV